MATKDPRKKVATNPPANAEKNSRRYVAVDGIVDRRAKLWISQIPHHRKIGYKEQQREPPCAKSLCPIQYDRPDENGESLQMQQQAGLRQ